MDPLSILIWTAVWAAVSAGIYVTVSFANLTLKILAEWFRRFAYLIVQNDRRSLRDRECLAFTVKQALSSGEYKIAQGIFNNQTETIEDARVVNASSLDWNIQSEHMGKDVVFW